MKHKWMLPVSAMLMPVIGLFFLYQNNAQYLSASQATVLALIMAAVSLAGYGAYRLIFRSSASALFGMLAIWVMFFAFSAKGYSLLSRLVSGYMKIAAVYALLSITVSIIIALATRRVKTDALPPIALTMAAALFLMNLYPVVMSVVQLEISGDDAKEYRREFTIGAPGSGPNVYWIHADGMLGFDAFNAYFGDDQHEYKAALKSRGFMINESATFECAHTTALAVPSLFSPDFYDREIAPRVKSHESAMALSADERFKRSDALGARVNNELRLAFEGKGYESTTLSGFGIYFPPVSDRFYMLGDSRGAYRLYLTGAGSGFESVAQLTEMGMLLFKAPSGMVFNAIARTGLPGMRREAIAHPAGDGLPAMDGENRVMFDALSDALNTQTAPALSIVNFLGAHFPYSYNEDGSPVEGDDQAIENYAGNHRYAAGLTIAAVDMIIAADPDAVIVIQADHGLHSQTDKTIKEAFGEAAVLPIWNQVMSAVRVPDKYRTGDEDQMMKTPLNITRYLVNTFVGENYDYIED